MFFGLGFWNKRLVFEVFLKVEDRWELHALWDREEDAIEDSRRLLLAGKTLSVKVVRLRTLSNGVSSETVVYEQEVQPRKNRPVTISTPQGDVAICATVDDLFAVEARRTISQVMRDYLFRANICTSELLHSYSHMRKLQDAQGLVNAAMHRIAMAQANEAKVAPKQRIQLLDTLLSQAQAKARTMAADRAAYPVFKGDDLAALSDLILSRSSLEHHDYILTSLLTVWLFDFRSLAAKVEALTLLAQANVENGLIRQVDAILSDMLIFADVVQDLFALHPNLGTALMQMGDVVLRRKGAVESVVNPTMRTMAALIIQGHMPHCQAALADRLLREINGDRPLDARAPENENALLDSLVKTLTGEDGTILGGERTRQSVEKRRLRQREQLLRAHGLHSVADNLRS